MIKPDIEHKFEAFFEPGPSPAMFAMGGACVCPLPGPCTCGAVLE